MSELINTQLGQYYLTDVIGRGSTSVVYRAYQRSLNRSVAVKVLASHLDSQFAARFTREAHAVAQLQHPNILPIYDYGEESGLRYFVTQYVEGSGTLADMLDGRPIEPIAALRLLLPLLSALTYAHAQGIVHRDIKPANIMLPRPDWPMLADFGIAKLLDDSQQLTPPGQSVGTATYMAPERATNRQVDGRTDLYSAGVVLYEMLTGRVPFDGVSPVDVLRQHVQTPPPAPRSINPRLPEVIEPLLLRALAKQPDDRFQSAAEMAQAIERVISQIERLEAQRQLQRLLQQPSGQSAPATLNPYETRELDMTLTGLPNQPARSRAWLPIGLAALVLLLLGGLLMTREARGGSGIAPSPTIAPATAPAVAAAPTNTSLPATVAPTAVAAPTAAAPPTATAAQPTAATRPATSATIRLEDTDWQSSYRRAEGRTYGGRTATWIYGSTTEYSSMWVQLDLRGQPAGTATLKVEGMDSEDRAKTPISITVNGVEVFRGPNPLPDDDQPLESGTWASYAWAFDAELLHPGQNEIRISNLAEGDFGRPPFFMLDYADILITSS